MNRLRIKTSEPDISTLRDLFCDHRLGTAFRSSRIVRKGECSMIRKVASVLLFWVRSPSIDVESQRVEVVVDGVQQSGAEFGPEVENMTIDVKASQIVTFKVITTDSGGLSTVSTSYTINLGDLEAPLPATGLGHEVMGIREEDDGEPDPETEL